MNVSKPASYIPSSVLPSRLEQAQLCILTSMCNVEEFGQHNSKNTTGPAGWASRHHGDLSHSWLSNDQILIFKEAFPQNQRHVGVKSYLKCRENADRRLYWVILAMLTVKLLVLSQRGKGVGVMAATEEVWTFVFLMWGTRPASIQEHTWVKTAPRPYGAGWTAGRRGASSLACWCRPYKELIV